MADGRFFFFFKKKRKEGKRDTARKNSGRTLAFATFEKFPKKKRPTATSEIHATYPPNDTLHYPAKTSIKIIKISANQSATLIKVRDLSAIKLHT